MVLVTPEAATKDGDGKSCRKLDTSSTTMERRLVEYFVIISSVPRNPDNKDEEKVDIHSTTQQRGRGWSANDVYDGHDDEDDEVFVDDYDFQPVITARYPLDDYAENPLHENVTFFCHPGGGIRLRTECSMPKVHYFIATGGHGGRMYGTCLTLWESYMITASKKAGPDGSVDEKSERKSKEVFLPKCLVILSTYPYLMAFREYLTQLNRLSKMGEMTLPLERYIANFCAEIPAPPPGSFEVQTTILDSVIKLWSPPHNLPIPWVSLPFPYPFQCLDIDNIILVWRCLTLERQVLLTSTQLSLLTTSAEILVSLLFPLRWSHAYIPVLPHFLIPILSAPMPFFCGINKANLADALCDLSRECVVVDLDKNLVTMGPSTEPLPPLPKALEKALRQNLEDNVGMVFREARSLTRNDDYSGRGIHLAPHVKLMADSMWESRLCLFDEAFHLAFTPEESRKNLLNGNDTSGIRGDSSDLSYQIMTPAEKLSLRKQSEWDAVQEAFLNSYVYFLRNYKKYLVFPSKENEGMYGGAGFSSKDFVDGQRYDMQDFLRQLIGTQMFDDFVTKRLYGSGEADVSFFDMAVDKFLKNQSLFGSLLGDGSRASNALGGDDHPLLQSAVIHRKLKTIVPPEPSAEDLPPPPADSSGELGGTAVITSSSIIEDDSSAHADDRSVGSASTQGTQSTRGSKSISMSLASESMGNKSKTYQSYQDKAEEILEKHRGYRYTYPTFPSEFNPELFGTPRPLPQAVIEEFDRQRKDAARFRRRKHEKGPKDKKQLQKLKSAADSEAPPSPEVATFTLFFMAFSAMVGKELLDIAHNPLIHNEREIFSSWDPSESEVESESELESVAGLSQDEAEEEPNYTDGLDEDEKAEAAEMKSMRPKIDGLEDGAVAGVVPAVVTDDAVPDDAVPDDAEKNSEEDEFYDAPEKESENLDLSVSDEKKDENSVTKLIEERQDEATTTSTEKDEATTTSTEKAEEEKKKRFRDPLSSLQIEEAKATGRAQLGLAFEMLTMMKKRALKADPEAYQCLIDACGRVGDTKRATELLAKMHEDGIVADGVVYSCLVSAFSADSAWKQGAGEQEDLPAWANSTAIEMDWNKLRDKKNFRDSLRKQIKLLRGIEDEDDANEAVNSGGASTTYQKLRNMIRKKDGKRNQPKLVVEQGLEFFVTESVERQIDLGEHLLEIVYPEISVDTDNETCHRCNFLLSDDDVVAGWKPNDSQDYTTSCPNCTQRFVPHFCVQSTSTSFMGSKGPASPLLCQRLSPWVLQKEIRSVMSDRDGIENLLSPEWREKDTNNAVLWWNLVLSCMRYRFPFTFLLQGSFEQNLIAPKPEDEA